VTGRFVFIIKTLFPVFVCVSPVFTDDTTSVFVPDTLTIEEPIAVIVDEFSVAVQLFDEGDYTLSMDHFRAIIDAHPQTSQGIESRFYLGMVYRHLGQPENARMTLQTFALTFPDHHRAPDAWWNIAEIYAEQSRFADAGFALERLFQFHPNHKIVPNAMLKASTYFEQSGDRKKSDEYLRRIILQHSLSDVSVEARLRFGSYRLDEGTYQQAADVFRRVIAEIPDLATDTGSTQMRAEAILGLARAYHNQGIYDRADEEYSRVINQFEHTPVYPYALLYRAELYREQGLHLEAVNFFRRVQRSVEGSDDEKKKHVARRAMFGIAESYNALGDYSSSSTFFDLYARQYAATATKDELITIWQGAARSNEGMRNYHRAVEWWDRIVEMSPDEKIKEEAYIRSAMNYIETGQHNKAAERLRAYGDGFQTPLTAEALYRLGMLYEEDLDDPRRALTAYEELAYRFPESHFIDDAVYGQARMHFIIGNDRTAHHIVTEFPERFPGSTLRSEVNALREELEIFHLLDPDGGFQNITMLLSEMISGAPRGDLAFQLGEIYLNKLKQYPEAARQFEIALSMDLPQDKKTQAEYLYAYSLYRTDTQIEGRRTEILARLRDLSLSAGQARSQNSESISYYYLQLLRSVGGPAEYIGEADRFTQSFPRSRHIVSIKLNIAEALEKTGDELSAIERYRDIIQRHQNQPEAGTATARLAHLYRRSGEEPAAMDLLASYLRHYATGTDIADVMLATAELHHSGGRYRDAIDLYRQFIRFYHYHDSIDDVRNRLAYALFENNRYNEAIELFEYIIDLYESSYFNPADVPGNIIYSTALSAYRVGDTDKAVSYFERYVVQDRSSEQAGIAAIILGELYNQRGRKEISDFYFGLASEIVVSGTPNKDIADLLYLNQKYEKALPHLVAVAADSPSDEMKIVYRTREITALLRMGRIDEGRRRIERFRQDFPAERNALAEFEFEIAMRHFRNRSYDNAARAFQEFIRQHQQHDKTAFAHFYLGRTWEAVGRRNDAKRKYEEILERYPGSGIIPDVHLSYGGLLLREEQFIDAIDHYRIVTQIASDDDDLMYFAMQNLAQAYEEIGFSEAALELIQEFIERYPNDPAVRDKQVKIGTLYQRSRLYGRSLDQFQSLILYADRALETELRYYTGDSYQMMGNHPMAIREFNTVAEIDPRSTQLDWTATALYMAGQSYEQMGNAMEAISMYQEIIDRRGIEGQYKAAARREIDRVRNAMNQ
jgi:tetratricopeptide (TPR) repeat protein